MQIQILEQVWAYYRGVSDADGCTLNDKSRAVGVYRDYNDDRPSLWYECSSVIEDCYGIPDMSVPPPWTVTFYFGDSPSEQFEAETTNLQTKKKNFIHEAKVELAFITTLTEQVSYGQFKHHRHFLWSNIYHVLVDGQYSAANTKFKPLHGTGFWISDFKHGGPVNRKYLAVLNRLSLDKSSTKVSEGTPDAFSYSKNWKRFPAMEQKSKPLVVQPLDADGAN
jgi:hypothetical protein